MNPKENLLSATQKLFARGFTFIFFAISGAIVATTVVEAIGHVLDGQEVTQIIVKLVNASVIAMAVYEVAPGPAHTDFSGANVLKTAPI
jgi:uncharacterized membrane protein YeaQ/YmgE (transglycosylase-associated protein family)